MPNPDKFFSPIDPLAGPHHSETLIRVVCEAQQSRLDHVTSERALALGGGITNILLHRVLTRVDDGLVWHVGQSTNIIDDFDVLPRMPVMRVVYPGPAVPPTSKIWVAHPGEPFRAPLTHPLAKACADFAYSTLCDTPFAATRGHHRMFLGGSKAISLHEITQEVDHLDQERNVPQRGSGFAIARRAQLLANTLLNRATGGAMWPVRVDVDYRGQSYPAGQSPAL
jgi:hypothetical protein